MNPPCEMSTEDDGELAVNFGLVNLGGPDSLATEHQTLTQKVWVRFPLGEKRPYDNT